MRKKKKKDIGKIPVEGHSAKHLISIPQNLLGH